MALPASAALIFLIAALPLGLAAVWTDITRMKIPNWVTDALLLAFIPLGLLALPWQVAAWQLLNPVFMLALGLLLHSLRVIGGGDIKFLIAASPFVMRPDLGFVAILLCVALLIGFAIHRLARRSPLARVTPHWASWHDAKRYPMGLSLGPTLIAYLVMAATG